MICDSPGTLHPDSGEEEHAGSAQGSAQGWLVALWWGGRVRIPERLFSGSLTRVTAVKPHSLSKAGGSGSRPPQGCFSEVETSSTSSLLHPPMLALLGPVPLAFRQKAEMMVCAVLQGRNRGVQAALVSSLILMISAKACTKLVWADLQLLSLRETQVRCQDPWLITSCCWHVSMSFS